LSEAAQKGLQAGDLPALRHHGLIQLLVLPLEVGQVRFKGGDLLRDFALHALSLA
jgi:hypothetical protein